MTDRSSLIEVRNPLLALPETKALVAVLRENPAVMAAFRVFLLALVRACAAKADKSWRTNKGPMAVYWKGASVYCRHLRNAIR